MEQFNIRWNQKTMDATTLKAFLSSLSSEDKELALNYLLAKSNSFSSDKIPQLSEARFASGLYCRSCGCTDNISKYGIRNGFQTYRCKNCGHIFTLRSSSILSGTSKSVAIWVKYIECMLDGFSLRKTAQICQISLKTAFIWRHKILDALTAYLDKNTKLSGVIEADETFFGISRKGVKNLEKKNEQKQQKKKPGISKDKICVACAIDRNSNVISRVSNYGRITTKRLHTLFDEKIVCGSIICTDKHSSYIRFAKDNNLELIQIKEGKHRHDIYHINHINAFHSKLKLFIKKFKGIATKYLDNYLTWNAMMNGKFGYTIALEMLQKAISEIYKTTVKNLCLRVCQADLA